MRIVDRTDAFRVRRPHAVEAPYRHVRRIRRREVDRRKAIALAINMAKPGDTVVIAGKGHEDYQILGAEKIHFSDVEVAAEEIRARA